MNIEAMRRRPFRKGSRSYAAFICQDCEYDFPDRLPPLGEALPTCKLCGGDTFLREPLRDDKTPYIFSASVVLTLVDLAMNHWPF